MHVDIMWAAQEFLQTKSQYRNPHYRHCFVVAQVGGMHNLRVTFMDINNYACFPLSSSVVSLFKVFRLTLTMTTTEVYFPKL